MAERIQRKRTKGWRLPPNTVCVTRPSKWGNPYKLSDYRFANADGSPAPHDPVAARAMATRDFRAALSIGALSFSEDDVRRELRGKNLACFCPKPANGEYDECHAAVLLEIANVDIQEALSVPGLSAPTQVSGRGVAGDSCGYGNECGRLGCPECQQ